MPDQHTDDSDIHKSHGFLAQGRDDGRHGCHVLFFGGSDEDRLVLER